MEEWRYSPIGDLSYDTFAPVLAPPDDAGAVPDALAAAIDDRAASVVIVDGWVTSIDLAPGWAEKGLTVEVDEARAMPELDEPSFFDHIRSALAPPPLVIKTAPGLTVRAPIVITSHHQSPQAASFGHIVVEAAEASDLTVVEHQTSIEGETLSAPLTELHAGNAARLRHQVIQDLDRSHWQLARLVTTAGSQSTLDAGVAAFGARYGRLRVDGRLTGRGATGQLTAAYYGDSDQIHDFRVFQHHDDRDTRSDLLFKGAQDDQSGSIYTGLIHIHPDGAGTNAFQTNRNVKLSPDAWAWSVPNLEIENNNVHCSHASTVSPVDEDQQFYLGSRGVPPVVADRLIVAGFFGEVVDRLPVEATHGLVREHISAKLDRRMAS